MGNLRLYVWRDVFEDWTSGAAWAFAESPEQARALVYASMEDFTREYWKGELDKAPEVYHSPIGFWQMGGA